MRKTIIITGLVCLICVFFFSCQSKEEKVLDRFENLSVKVEKNASEFTPDQWDELFHEIEVLDKDMEKCNFTESQQERIELLRGRLAAVILKEKVRSFGTDMSIKVKQWGEYCKGFMQGLTGDMSEENNE